jgi:hypothetical protein
MLTRRLLPLSTLSLLLLASTAAAQQPTPWPDLDVLKPFKGWKTNSCSIDGAGKPGTEKARSNRLKNRYHLPPNGFQEITYEELMALDKGRINSKNEVVDFPQSDHPDNQRAVSFVGYVVKAFAAGCSVRTDKKTGKVKSQGESCNCNTADKRLCDTHIDVVLNEGASHKGGRGVIVVEVSERSRRLARMGLLKDHNTVGSNWSSWALGDKKSKNRIVGKWVRFYGWLFFDVDHADQGWDIDPNDTVGRENFRQTAWEIHPVMGIEVLPGPPPGFQPPPVTKTITQPSAQPARPRSPRTRRHRTRRPRRHA